MRILILSDSHSTLINLALPTFDRVIHCGDYGRSFSLLNECNISYVKGNCDTKGEDFKITNIENKKVFITHGHYQNVKYGYERLIYKALELEVNLVFFGHTHNPTYFVEDGITFINPGAYEDGNYVIIDDDKIFFYNNKKVLAQYDIKW